MTRRENGLDPLNMDYTYDVCLRVYREVSLFVTLLLFFVSFLATLY